MKRVYIIFAIAAIGVFTSWLTRAQSSDLVIQDVTVLSPERAAHLEHAYVRIHDGRIAEVSRQAIEGGRKINGTGRFLVPGLIDSPRAPR
jgi:imidazolonepropionase-like amidohydrolase